MDPTTSTITASAMAVAIIQWMKNTKLIPFMDQHTDAINRLVAWIAATISAFGIHYNYDATAGTLTLTGLTAAGIGHSLWEVIRSYAFQILIYKGVMKPAAAPATVPAAPVAKP